MKKFILRILISILIPSIVIFITYQVYSFKIDSLLSEGKYSTIICGDSHAKMGISSVTLKNAINISNHAENYFFTFNMLENYIDKQPKIDTVILSCSFHSFERYLDIVNYSESQFLRYFLTLKQKNKVQLIKRSPINFMNSILPLYTQMFNFIRLKSNSYTESPLIEKESIFYNSTLDTKSLLKTIKFHYSIENSAHRFSINQKKYFLKIVELCKKRNIKLILVNTPIHKDYFLRIPKKSKLNYYSIIHKNQLSLYDFHSFKLEDKYFKDYDHINKYGAVIFTKKLRDSLKIKG